MTDDRTLDAAELTATGSAPAAETQASLVVHENDRGTGARVVALPDGVEVTFGRSRASTVAIDHEKVSRAHARILRRGVEVVVEDLGSRNGTTVNGERITGPTRVVSGDEIGVGPALAVVAITRRWRRRATVGSMSFLYERLAAELDRCARYQRPLGLLMLRLEGSASAVEAALDRVANALRRMDSLAEYGPEELAIVLPEAAAPAAEAAARQIVDGARGPAADVTARVGFATCPADGREPAELVSRARAALRRARAGEGDGGIAGTRGEDERAVAEPIVASGPMRRVYETVARIAPTPITVLLLGETGVGKELVAAELHRRSERAARPFVKLSCASLPETLLESELFGHERGAFTGADRKKVGYFEAANEGTIFLDEIGEMPVTLQAKLLRVLETRRITRVGATAEREVDVRVVCATNRDLEEEIRGGRFREDLFFRVSAFTLAIPPLRERRPDIRLLAEHFARRFASEVGCALPSLSAAAVARLEAHDWPGNVRELRNAIERAVVLQRGDVIELEDLPDSVNDAERREAEPRGAAPVTIGDGVDMRGQMAQVERGAIVATLEACGGNQTRAAARLGISRRALIYKMEKYGLKPPPGGTG